MLVAVVVAVLGIVAFAPVHEAAADPGYVVQEGDTLGEIAERLGLPLDQAHLVYDTNAVVIDDAAQAFGHADSNNGELLIPGTVLATSGLPGTTASTVGASSDAQPADPAPIEPFVVHEGIPWGAFAGTVGGLAALVVLVVGAVVGYFVYLGRRPTPTTT